MDARYWAVTDLETTGLNPDKHEIIQIARVVVDVVDRVVVPGSLVYNAVLPSRWENRDHKAMAINRISREYLNANGVTLFEALKRFSQGINWENTVLASWGTDFELKFLTRAFQETGRPIPYHYQAMDIRSQFQFRRAKIGFTTLARLSDGCKEYGAEFITSLAHSAVYDANVAADILLGMLGDSR